MSEDDLRELGDRIRRITEIHGSPRYAKDSTNLLYTEGDIGDYMFIVDAEARGGWVEADMYKRYPSDFFFFSCHNKSGRSIAHNEVEAAECLAYLRGYMVLDDLSNV